MAALIGLFSKVVRRVVGDHVACDAGTANHLAGSVDALRRAVTAPECSEVRDNIHLCEAGAGGKQQPAPYG